MLEPIIGGYDMPKLRGETFAAGSKTMKFVNVFHFEVSAIWVCMDVCAWRACTCSLIILKAA